MEKANINFKDGENALKTICWILSVLSWLLLLVTGWISLNWFKDKLIFPCIWTIQKIHIRKILDQELGYYAPLQMQISLIYIVFILAMVITLVGFVIYMIKSTCKKDDVVFGGMIGKWSQYHFIPLLCVSALFIIGECTDTNLTKENHFKDMHISGLIFTIFGLISLIFIYIMTDFNSDWYVILTLKKGTYSCFITLMWYYFCYNIYYIRIFDTYKDEYNWRKGCGIAFSIIFGIGALVFSFFFKDLVIAGMTTLIYVGLTAYYFSLNKEIRKHESANKNGDGAVDIIMMVLSIVLIVFLIIKYKDQCLKS